MTSIGTLVVTSCMAALSALSFGQSASVAQTAPSAQTAPTAPAAKSAAPAHLTAAEAKSHVGDTVTVCGKVVDNQKVPKYGIAGHGRPVSLDLDQPEPNPIFFFVTFGEKPGGPQEAIAAYKDKQVCVTGKVASTNSGAPFILAPDRSQIQVQAENK